MSILSRSRVVLVALLALWLADAAPAVANTSHEGWPQFTGMLLMNKRDQARPLDGRPGADPFGGIDAGYSCDGAHRESRCLAHGPAFASPALPCQDGHAAGPFADLPPFLVNRLCSSPRISAVPADVGHNELLGGHGSDVIHAGPAGDVLWGDYKPSGQPTTQVDRLYGGAGDDFIYASHGTNYIWTGGGRDVVHAHFGHGEIHCDSKTVTVYLSRVSQRRYRVFGCRHISYFTRGY